jgi:citrate lyase beta subunit
LLQKSLAVGSDVIIYDLEDSVAPSEKGKSEARERLTEFLTARSSMYSTRPSLIPCSRKSRRINYHIPLALPSASTTHIVPSSSATSLAS